MFALKFSFITVFSAAYITMLMITSMAADALILAETLIMKSSPQMQTLQALNPAHSYFHRMQILPAHRPRLMLLQALSLLQVLRLLIAQLLLFQLSLEILSALEHLILLNPDPALILDWLCGFFWKRLRWYFRLNLLSSRLCFESCKVCQISFSLKLPVLIYRLYLYHIFP